MATAPTALDPNSPAGKYMQQQAAQYGLTVDQYNQLQSQYAPTYTQNSQGGQEGKSAGGSYGQNPDLTNVLNTLAAQKQFGLGQQQQQQQGPPASNPGGVSQDPMNAATNWGAAALNTIAPGSSAGLAVYNPTPGQASQGPGGASGNFNKSGVNNVAPPTSSNVSPTAPYLGVPSVFSAAPMPTGATALNAQGQLPGTPTPMMPANAPGARAPATPYASAPPAPGVNVVAPTMAAAAAPPPDPMQHTAGLINAGKAIYAHFGGDPSSASPQDLMDFHGQLQGMIGAASPAAQNYTAGLPPGSSTAGPTKMATGGLVPGRGNQDTVPALLTPGEYVIPKAQAQQMNLPLRMADGGYVPDPKDRDRPIPRSMSGAPSQAEGSTAGSGSQALPQQQQAQSQAPSAPGNDQSQQGHWSQMVQQAQAAQANQAWNAMGTGGYSAPTGSSAETVGDVANGAAVPGAGQTQDLGTTGSGAAGAVAGGADVASGVIQALQTAVDTYAKSIKPWQTQAQAFGKQGTPQYQTPTFREEGA